MIPLGVFGILYIPSNIIVEGDLAATANAILYNELTYRLSILSALSVQVVQVFVVLALYKVLAPVSKSWAVIMVALILVAVPIAMLNEVNLLAIIHVIKTPELSNTLISVFLEIHQYGVIIAQYFGGFGCSHWGI